MEPTGRVASESATATRGAGREHIPRRARFRVTTRGRGNPTTRHVGFRPRLAREELQAEFHGASARARRSRVAPRVAIARFPRAARISRLTRAANRARDRDAVRARSRRFPGGDSPPRQKSAARPNPRPRARFAAEVPARRRRERVALLGQPSRRKESRNHSSQDGSPRPPPEIASLTAPPASLPPAVAIVPPPPRRSARPQARDGPLPPHVGQLRRVRGPARLPPRVRPRHQAPVARRRRVRESERAREEARRGRARERHVRRTLPRERVPTPEGGRRAQRARDAVESRRTHARGGAGETASHTTPFAWCTPFFKDFSRRHSSPALPFQRLTGKTFN